MISARLAKGRGLLVSVIVVVAALIIPVIIVTRTLGIMAVVVVMIVIIIPATRALLGRVGPVLVLAGGI